MVGWLVGRAVLVSVLLSIEQLAAIVQERRKKSLICPCPLLVVTREEEW